MADSDDRHQKGDTADFFSWFTETLGREPYPWQAAMGAATAPGHRLIRVPTGFGKTLGVAATWLFHRVVANNPHWPLRLIWTLPMRTLVEQTERECRKLVAQKNLLWDGVGTHDGKVGVHALMGGSDAGSFHLHPEHPAILIGTQDMLLSRALNRGYGAARARWPMDFGLLSQDALWVLDEVQLMGVGFATALQLAAFRNDHASLRPTHTWAMSATLQRAWLNKSPDTHSLAASMQSAGLLPEDEALPLWASTTKPVERLDPTAPAALAARIIEAHRSLDSPAPLTLAVANTVDRARALFDELEKRAGTEVTVHLLHSRFRGAERRGWTDTLQSTEGSRILVATQVVEAGVDVSADLLVTEICPWPSLVQRLGRLARRGGSGSAFVVGLDTAKHASPYESDALDAAWDALEQLSDVSPRALEAFEAESDEALRMALYPFDPPHLVLREEIAELFDTTPDLSGGDIDVSRFIREGDERDVSVAWFAASHDSEGHAERPAPTVRPGRDSLCAVPFLAARDWLCGKKSGGVEPKHLRKGVSAFVWDYLEGAWCTCKRSDLRPGVTVLVTANVGGYDPRRGFDAESRAPVPLVPLLAADAQERTDAAQDHEDLSWTQWQTIGFHGRAVANELGRVLQTIALPDQKLDGLLDLAARWHDLGKAHPAFQGAIAGDERPPRADLAKAPPTAWRKGRCIYQMGDPPERRPSLRHELASVLALFDVLSRWAPPDHPARLGAMAMLFPDTVVPPTEGRPSPIEAEVLALSADDFDLVAYLVCAHHGKLRARLHASPADQAAAIRRGSLPIRGIYDGDVLPAVELSGPTGEMHLLAERTLSLEPAALGLSALTGRSWTERADALRKKLGPFALAYLEALLRAADVRASMDTSLEDPCFERTP